MGRNLFLQRTLGMNFVPSSFSSLDGFFWPLVFATSGGLLVILGLSMEKFSEWLDDRYLAPPEKPHKYLEAWGWRILMLGICLEVGDAAFAALDGWKTKQMAIKMKEADTRNLPINSISGYARIEIRPHGEKEISLAKNLVQVPPNKSHLFSDIEMQKSEMVLMRFGKYPSEDGGSEIGILGQVNAVSTIVDDLGPYIPNICFDITFDSTKGPDFWNLNGLTFNELKFVWIAGVGKDRVLPPLEVIGGHVDLKINRDWPKTFTLPSQTNKAWNISSIETNNFFVPAGQDLNQAK